jgi:hypothetical protein
MSQTPYSEEPISPIGRIDIGPGGIISDSRENRELLEIIENAPALSPIELHTLAVSYQQFESNSALGNRLAFIALNNIFQDPLLQQYLSTPSRPVQTDLTFWQWYCCTFGGGRNCGVTCPRVRLADVVKRVPYAGLELLIEVKLVDEHKTYAVIGVSPSRLKTEK